MTQPESRSDRGGARPGFWAELRRRKVVRVAGVYAGTAFVVVQAASLFLPRVGLPDWTVTLVVWLALLGFPLALVLAWAFEVTPDGVRRTEAPAGDAEQAPVPRDERESSRLLAVFAAGVLVAGIGYGAHAAWSGAGTPGPGGSPDGEGRAGTPASGADAAAPAAASVAVLPFEDLSATGDQAWFGDGVAEEILDKLAQVRGLEVKARRSSFRFRGGELGIRSIADSLDVGAVLEGSVRKAGDRVRVTAQLIDGRTANHLWSESYERELSDIFGVQEDIARRVAAALEVELGAADRRRLARRGTDDLEAYSLYLRGRHSWRERAGERMLEAEHLFRRALERDSTFAAAWSGLADTYLLLPAYAAGLIERSREELREQAERAARRALALDPTLAEAHASLAHLLMLEHRWEASGSAFRRAVELNPSYATARHWYAIHLGARGRLEEAVEQADRGARLDPFSWPLASVQAILNAYAGHEEVAEEARRRALAVRSDARVGPGGPQAQELYLRAYVLAAGGDSAAARAMADSVLAESPDRNPALEVALRIAAGQRAELREAMRRRESGGATDGQLTFAAGHAVLGELDRAFEVLEGLEMTVLDLVHLRNAPPLAPLRADPRYADVLADYGLTP